MATPQKPTAPPAPPVQPERAPGDRTGDFVDYGATFHSTLEGEWLVDPDTGLITGPAGEPADPA